MRRADPLLSEGIRYEPEGTPIDEMFSELLSRFDLIETDANDEPERWVEVKAMKGSLENRPVGLFSVQFEFARQHGEQYWLYVVEHAGDPDRARIIKIKNPAGRAGTFTFGKGWTAIAVIDGGLAKAS